MFFKFFIWFQIISQIFCAQDPKTQYAVMEVQEEEAKRLASIRFGKADKHLCLGVVLGRRTILTSAPCLNTYIPVYDMFNEGFREGRCSVTVGVMNEEQSNTTSSKRICKRFLMNNSTWWSWGSKFNYDHPVHILVDFPLDTAEAEVLLKRLPPVLKKFNICKVYGWASRDENSENSTKALMATVAMPLNDTACDYLYRERMRAKIPPHQFCVVEGRIDDEGRVLVCDKKLLGVFAKRLTPLYGKEFGNVSVYTFAGASERLPYFAGHPFWTFLNLLSIFSIAWYMYDKP